MTSSSRSALSPEVPAASRPRRDQWRAIAGVVSAFRARLPLTSLGWPLCAFVVAALVLARQSHWEEAGLAATAGGLLLLLGLPFLLRRARFDVALNVARPRVVVGDRVVGTVGFTNRSRGWVLPQRAELQAGGQVIPVGAPKLAPGAPFERKWLLDTDRRTVLTVGPVTIVRGDPIGLFRREVRHGEELTVFVHPVTVGLPALSQGWAQDFDGPTYDNSPRGEVAFHTLREYVPGDARHHIHWRSTARTGKLMVKQYVDNRRPQLAILLADDSESYPDPQSFETAVSVVASIERASLAAGQSVVHHAGGRRHNGPRLDDLLDHLATINTSGDTTLVSAARSLEATDADATVGVIVVGPGTPDEMLARSARFLSRGRRVVTIRVVSRDAGVRHGNASLTDLRIESLTDLVHPWTTLAKR